MRTKVLVTGGAGFIGSHVADACLAEGYEVVVMDDLSGGYLRNVPKGATFLEGSITDPAFVEDVFEQHHFEHVYHLAAYAAEGLSHFIRRYNYTNNTVGSINLINASVNHGVKTFVFTSSIAVYGPCQVPMHEDTHPEPEDPYGISKYAVELDLACAKRMFGLDFIVLRPHNVYGERQNTADKYRNVIGIFMNQILHGQPCTVFGDGLQTRAFTHVADIAPVIARSVRVPAARNQVFNVGADKPYSVKYLAEVVQKAMGVTTGVKHLDARKEVVHAYSDHGKAAAILDYHPKIGLERGIEQMVDWVKAVGPCEPVEFKGIEVEKNMPPSWRSVVTA
jgi:UDP-glucose 4-epimerase